MKHVKRFITERKQFAPYKKYLPILLEMYDASEAEMYEENGKIHLTVEKEFLGWTKKPVYKDYVFNFMYEMESLGNYHLGKKMYAGSVYMIFMVDDVSDKFMNKLEIELQSKKYNL